MKVNLTKYNLTWRLKNFSVFIFLCPTTPLTARHTPSLLHSAELHRTDTFWWLHFNVSTLWVARNGTCWDQDRSPSVLNNWLDQITISLFLQSHFKTQQNASFWNDWNDTFWLQPNLCCMKFETLKVAVQVCEWLKWILFSTHRTEVREFVLYKIQQEGQTVLDHAEALSTQADLPLWGWRIEFLVHRCAYDKIHGVRARRLPRRPQAFPIVNKGPPGG